MDKVTYDALVKSVAKWKTNARVHSPENAKLGPEYCPLCKLFNLSGESHKDCIGCPVHSATGKQYCFGTPYDDAERANSTWNASFVFESYKKHEPEYRKKWRVAARKEAEFLAALVPAGGADE